MTHIIATAIVMGGIVSIALTGAALAYKALCPEAPESRRLRAAREESKVAAHKLEQAKHEAQEEVVQIKRRQLVEAIGNGHIPEAEQAIKELTGQEKSYRDIDYP